MRMAIRRSSYELILLCLTFFELSILPHNLFLAFKYLVLLFIFIKYCSNFFSEKLIYTFIILYGGITVFSTIINHMLINTIVASIFYLIQIIDIFIFTQAYLKRYTFKELLQYVAIIFSLICILNDVLILFISYDFANPNEEYLMGSKFAVSYFHAFTLSTLYCLFNIIKHHLNILQRLCIITFSIISFLVCARINCMTGFIVNIVASFLMIMPKSKMGFAMNGKFLIIATTVINILIFSSYSLLTNPILQNLFVNVFHKSTNLTGRIQIYSIIMTTIRKKILVGYGYFNGVVESILGYGNAQNGIMKILIDSGILGLIGYIGIIYFGLESKKQRSAVFWPLFAFLYAMIIGSMVEINLTYMIIFFVVAIIFESIRKSETIEKR